VPDIIDRLRLFGEEAVSSMNVFGLFFSLVEWSVLWDVRKAGRSY
jgi:hypothetical protein